MSFSGGPIHTKRAPRKQTFTVLVCGASGTGKSAFINTFVGHKVLYDSERAPESSGAVHFQPTAVELDNQLSDGARLALTMVETENFGTALDHSSDVDAVARFIENRFDEVLAEESRIRRNPRFKDNRVDACIYFIEPTGHGLREIDVLALRRLASIVNVIPVLARADTLTPSEVVANKRLVSEDMRFYDLETFGFQYAEDGSSNNLREESELAAALPFAITTSSEFGERGEALFVRRLTYGSVHVLDPQQSDFQMLRNALVDEFLMELKDRTHDVLYENFRTQRLDPKAQHRQSMLMPQQLAEHAARLKQAQIDRENAMLRERERRVNAEIQAKQALLAERERQLCQLDQQVAEKQAQPELAASGSTQSFASQSTSLDTETSQTYQRPSQASRPPPIDLGYVDTVDGDEVQTGGISPGSEFEEPQSASSRKSQFDPYEQSAEPRLRHKPSQKELRDHTDQLHAELGDLETQRQSIQQQYTSVSNMPSQGSRQSSDQMLPLNIKKTAQT